MRFTPRVLSLSGDGRLSRQLADAGIAAETWRGGPASLRMRLARDFDRTRPDIVYLFGLRSDLLARGPAKRAGAAVLSGIRNTDPWRRPWHVALDRLTAKHVDLFIANAQAGRQSRIERERFAPERIAVIHNGIQLPALTDREPRRAAFREAHRIPPDAPLVGLIANYRPQKGHDLALAAFDALKDERTDLRLVFAGDDYMNGAIRQTIDGMPGARDRILSLPHQPPDELATIYAALDLFILPSRYEGTPNTMMEAMAWGVPCIATRVGGIPEVLREEDGGILLPPDDVPALAAALRQRLALPPAELRALGRAHRDRIETAFSIAAMVRAHETLFWHLRR